MNEVTAETATAKWWGYRHTSGTVQVKNYNGDRRSIDDAYESDFVAQVVEPFDACSLEEAEEAIARRTASTSARPRSKARALYEYLGRVLAAHGDPDVVVEDGHGARLELLLDDVHYDPKPETGPFASNSSNGQVVFKVGRRP